MVSSEKCPGEAERLRFSKFWREDEETEKFWVLTSNMSRLWLETPASMTIKRQMSDAKVKPKGRPTQRNLPTPIFEGFSVKRMSI